MLRILQKKPLYKIYKTIILNHLFQKNILRIIKKQNKFGINVDFIGICGYKE
jgi:hypothetical protein